LYNDTSKNVLGSGGFEVDEYNVILCRPKVPTNIRGYRWSLVGTGGGIAGPSTGASRATSPYSGKDKTTGNAPDATTISASSSRSGKGGHKSGSGRMDDDGGGGGGGGGEGHPTAPSEADDDNNALNYLYAQNLAIARDVAPSKRQVALYFRDTASELRSRNN